MAIESSARAHRQPWLQLDVVLYEHPWNREGVRERREIGRAVRIALEGDAADERVVAHRTAQRHFPKGGPVSVALEHLTERVVVALLHHRGPEGQQPSLLQ